ncbi:MAG: hypothetical protein C5B45_05075 [Chlamydiae bacterium]|nr:MAG: hypothetical protein C5B45_05075 [Chlamydiota bacterium]
MSSQDGDIPLLAKTVAGNTSDKELFRERLKKICKNKFNFVADSALYAKTWITKVPETLSEVKQITQHAEPLEDLEQGVSSTLKRIYCSCYD